jgi:hypothetical protein
MLDGVKIRDGDAETVEALTTRRAIALETHEPTVGVHPATLIPPITISVSKRNEVVVFRLPWIRPL